MSRLTILVLVLALPFSARAGCAVALEIRPNGGIFTHSESSNTPKGGHNFISAADAATALMDDLKRQSITTATIIFQSDETGYFSIAVGHGSDGKVISYVACKPNPRESDKAAVAGLKAKGADDATVSGRFHSYGDAAKSNATL